MTNLHNPPAHLSPEAADWWRAVLRDYDLGPHHLHLLKLACEALDRAAQARQALADHGGLVFTDERGVIRAHPCVAHERDSRIAFARLVRELDLDGGSVAEAPRPPALVSNRRGA